MINLIVIHLGIINYMINIFFVNGFVKKIKKILDFVVILYYTIYSFN